MVDFHSHILPGIDDGSASTEESVSMLNLSARQGVTHIAATSHYYASQESPDSFLRHRERAWHRLQRALTPEMPKIYLGAEVYYFDGITRSEDIHRLCIGNSRVLLLEMPFRRWSDRMVNDVITLAQDTDMTILLAHIDRYLSDQPKDTWDRLEENGVLFQVNASFFLGGWMERRKAFKLLSEERIAVLGSDCHNMRSRRPNTEEACKKISSKAGPEAVERLTVNGLDLLGVRHH